MAAMDGGSHWTSQRVEIEKWLREQAPSLAELYAATVTLLYVQPLVGGARLVAHAVGEFMNLCRECGVRIAIGGPYNSGILAAQDFSGRVSFNYATDRPEPARLVHPLRRCRRPDLAYENRPSHTAPGLPSGSHCVT